MKRWAFLLTLLLATTVRAADEIKFGVTLDEPASRPKEAIRWPVTVGVPFAAGAISDSTPISVFDASGKPVSLQTKVIGRWLPNPNTPQWVLLDFQGNFTGHAAPAFTVRTGTLPPLEHTTVAPDQAEGQVPGAVKVEDSGGKITVDTGAVSFTVDKKHFSLFDTFKAADAGQVLDGSSIYWINDQGKRLEAKAYGESTVEVETKGPMRTVIKAEGWYAPVDAPQQKMMRYEVRIAAFAGLPYVRVYHTFIWTTDDKMKLKEFGLSFHLAREAATGKIGLEGGSAIDGPLNAKALEGVQIKHDKTPRLAGWAQAGTLGVALMDMSSQLPKAWALYHDHVDLQLWAPQAGPLSMVDNDRTLDILSDSQKEWPQFNGKANPQGVAKTHEIWLWPIGAKTPPAEAINDYVQHPIVAMADAVYQCSTDAMLGLRAAAETPKEYKFIEDGMTSMFRYIAEPQEKLKDFDMLNFGSAHLFSPAGWRGYDNNTYNWSQTPWRLFYRSGSREFFMHGVRNARQVMDVAVCHDGLEKGPPYKEKVVGYGYMMSPLPWGWGALGDNFNTHPQYLLHYYHLTGYERAAEVLTEMTKASKLNIGVNTVEEWKKTGMDISRELYGKLVPKTVYYQFTGDPSFLQQAQKIGDLALAFRNREGHFTGNNFWYFFHRGMLDTSRLTGDMQYENGILALTKDFAQPADDPVTAPFWYGSSMLVFSAAYRQSKNAQYLQYPIQRIIDETRLVQTTGPLTPWHGGQGAISLQRNEYPVFFDGAFELLGAWHDAGFPPVHPTRSNNAYFGSRIINEGVFKSTLTLYVKKEAGKAGQLVLHFQDANYQPVEEPYEAGTDKVKPSKKMEARITGPDGQTRTVPAEIKFVYDARFVTAYIEPDPIKFAAGDAPGVYKVQVMAAQQLFWLAPRTDLPGLVVEIPDGKLSYKFRDEPGRIYFRLAGGAPLVLKAFSRQLIITPLRVTDPAGATLAFYPDPGPPALTVNVPAKDQDQLLAICKGFMDFSPKTTEFPDVPSLVVQGAQPWFAVQPDQWFAPGPGQSR